MDGATGRRHRDVPEPGARAASLLTFRSLLGTIRCTQIEKRWRFSTGRPTERVVAPQIQETSMTRLLAAAAAMALSSVSVVTNSLRLRSYTR